MGTKYPSIHPSLPKHMTDFDKICFGGASTLKVVGGGG
jgi:hypothetical protein